MRWLSLVVGIAVAVSAGLVTTCGGDDGGDRDAATATSSGDVELSLEEYFQRIDTIFETTDRELEDVDAQLQASSDAADTLEKQIEALEIFADASAEVLSRSLSDLDGIDEPAAVDEAHSAFVSAIGDALTATERLQDDVDAIQSEEELELLFSQFQESFSVLQPANTGCFQLQTIADDAGIDIDLNCGD